MDKTRLKILIVEDDPIIATDISSLLKHDGYKVIGTAKNASRAIDMLSTTSPNFVILDIHLGIGDTGIDVAEVIHNKYHLPYIFLTSFSDEDTLEAAQEQAPYGYLVKPFQDKTLLATIAVAWSNFERSKKAQVIDFEKFRIQLTDQEKTICRHLIKGASYRQICDALFISLNTLKYHVKNIYSKYDVSGRSELAALFHQ